MDTTNALPKTTQSFRNSGEGKEMKIDRVLKMNCLLCVLAWCISMRVDAAQGSDVKIVSIEFNGHATDKAEKCKLRIGSPHLSLGRVAPCISTGNYLIQ